MNGHAFFTTKTWIGYVEIDGAIADSSRHLLVDVPGTDPWAPQNEIKRLGYYRLFPAYASPRFLAIPPATY